MRRGVAHAAERRSVQLDDGESKVARIGDGQQQ
jgi:hypothetical protein